MTEDKAVQEPEFQRLIHELRFIREKLSSTINGVYTQANSLKEMSRHPEELSKIHETTSVTDVLWAELKQLRADANLLEDINAHLRTILGNG